MKIIDIERIDELQKEISNQLVFITQVEGDIKHVRRFGNKHIVTYENGNKYSLELSKITLATATHDR